MGAYQKIYELMGKRFIDVAQNAIFPLTKDSQVFYVNSVNGSDSYGGKSRFSPLATIAKAISLCTAAKGDIIIVEAEHVETITTAIAMSKSHVQLIGEKAGNLCPVITPNGVINAITITAAGCLVQGLKFAAPGTDAQTADINIAAANVTIRNTSHIASAGGNLNKVNVIVLNTGGDDALIDGVKIFNPSTEVPAAIKIAAAVARAEICNCLVLDVVGYTNGAIYDAAAATDLYVHHCTFQNAKAATAVVNYVANSVGVTAYCNISGRHTTIASNVVTGTSHDFFQCYTSEEPCKNGMLIPIIDAD